MTQPDFTALDLQLLQLLARGKPIKSIAAEMRWTLSSTKAALTKIYKALDVHSSTAAVAWYVQNHARHTRLLDDKARRYRRALVEGGFEGGTTQWSDLPAKDRPADARIYICVMYLLDGKSGLAMEESNALAGQEAGLVFLLQQWLAGDENALPMVRNLLVAMPSGARAKHAGYLALYHGGLRKNLASVAAAAAHALVVELEDETV